MAGGLETGSNVARNRVGSPRSPDAIEMAQNWLVPTRCATTSATVQPSHRLGARHWSSLIDASTSASRRRWRNSGPPGSSNTLSITSAGGSPYRGVSCTAARYPRAPRTPDVSFARDQRAASAGRCVLGRNVPRDVVADAVPRQHRYTRLVLGSVASRGLGVGTARHHHVAVGSRIVDNC